MKYVYKNEFVTLLQGDSLKLLQEFEDESIDVIMTDPPYFLSKGGISCQNGKMVSVNKGDWDKVPEAMTVEEFYERFLLQAKRILKPNGTIWVFGTLHNIYTIGYLMQKLDYRILNNITWQKSNPAPNLSCRMFTHSTETIIWARKDDNSKHFYNYELMKEINHNKQMKDVWTSSTTKPSEKLHGKHPTQKPIGLMERMILASSKEGDVILDCFAGSGTTLVAGYPLKRHMIGIELEDDFINVVISRLKEAELKAKQQTLF